jgi:hypothetical protein
METWSTPIFGPRHYKSFCVLHIECAASTAVKSIVARQVVMRIMMRGLGAPQLAKIWEVLASLALSAPRTTKTSLATPTHLIVGGDV